MSHTRLHEAIADAVAGAEAAVEDAIEGRAPYIVTLLREPTKRDEMIWRRCFAAAEAAGGPLVEDDWDVDADDLVVWPREERGFRWAAIIQTMLAAAQAQYDAENILRPLWEALQAGGLGIMAESAGVPRPLSKEAKKGPGRSKFEAAKNKRRGGNVAV